MLVTNLVLFVLTIILLEIIPQSSIESFSSSSFDHQEISDPPKDWFLFEQNSTKKWLDSIDKKVDPASNLEECNVPNLPPNIAAVTYISDGVSLNGTIWLTSPLKETSSHRMGYTISIDVPTTYDTGTDYYINFYKDPNSKTWQKNIQESSSSRDQTRDISGPTNYTDSKYNVSYFPFHFKLSDLNSPGKYKMIITAFDQFLNNKKFCYLVDITGWIEIPPPRYNITILPSSAILRPYEEIDIQLNINAIANIASIVNLSSYEDKGLDISFNPDKIYLPSKDVTTTSIMKIKSVTTPDKPEKKIVSIAVEIRFISESRMLGTNSEVVRQTMDNKINQNYRFIVQVLPPLTILDYLKIMANDVVSPLGIITTFIITLITALATVSAFIIKKRKEKKSRVNYKK